MEPIAVLFLLIVLGCIAFYITRPFFEKRRFRTTGSSHSLSFLLAERDSLLTALQELDFDQSLGKIPAEDYPAQRALLIQKGANVLRKLDALSPGNDGQPDKYIKDSKSILGAKSTLSDDDLEDLLAKRRNNRKDKTAGFCPMCGKPVLQSDIFCPSCGGPRK
jgi:hypothetical protein